VDSRGRSFSREMKPVVANLGVPFENNPNFLTNTLGRMPAAYAARDLGVFERFYDGICSAFWTAGAGLGEPRVVEAVLSEAGLDVVAIVTASQGAPAKNMLSENSPKQQREPEALGC
jgi:2-hydroxychromene-2-carboxylate isomerase